MYTYTQYNTEIKTFLCIYQKVMAVLCEMRNDFEPNNIF